MKTKALAPIRIVGEEWISLTDPQALLLANDKLNDDFAGQYVAYVDHKRGNHLHRRILAHDRQLGRVQQAMERLPQKVRKDAVVHYASEFVPDSLDVHFDMPGRV